MTSHEAERLGVGDRVRLDSLTATIVEAGPDYVAIQWDERPLPELYTRGGMMRFSLYNGGEQQ
jgi:hypothetical protein